MHIRSTVLYSEYVIEVYNETIAKTQTFAFNLYIYIHILILYSEYYLTRVV
jgi:hypothetical protein